MYNTISPKKIKKISYNYDKLSPERESARDEEEKGIKRQKEERSFQISSYGEKNNKKNDEKLRNKSNNFAEKVKSCLNSLNFQTNRYHFVELYIFFNLYLKDNFITQEGFINANMMVFTPLTKSRLMEKHENHKKIITKIFKLYDVDNKKQIHVDSIIDYLRILSQQTEIFTVDSMFNILDKENKGFISQEEIIMFIEGINDFLNSNYYSSEILEKQERLDKSLKKFFVKNRDISKEKFEKFYEKELLELRDLITEAEEIIMRKQIDTSVDKKNTKNIEITNNLIQNDENSISSNYSIKDSLILNESKLEENKDTILKTKSRKSKENPIDIKLNKQYQGSPYKIENKLFEDKTENLPTVSQKNSQKDFLDVQKEKEKKFVEKISNLSPIKQSKHIYYTDDKKIVFENKVSHQLKQSSTNTLNEIILEDLIDYDKNSIIDSIKLSTNLYSFKSEELLEDFIKISSFKKVLNRKEFVNIFTNVILTNSFDFYIFKIKRGINELFNLLTEGSQNEITCNEAIGSIIMLTNGNEEEKISAIFQLVNMNQDHYLSQKIRFSEVLTGIFRLYFKKGDNFLYNSKLLAEELTNKFFLKFNIQCELKFHILEEEFLKWVYKEEFKNKVDINSLNTNRQIKNNEASKSVISISAECDNLFEKLTHTENLVSNVSNYLDNLQKSFLLNQINVLEAAEIFKKNSLLGVLNKSQIFQSFKDIYKVISVKNDVPSIEEMFNKLFRLIESKNEFYNLLEIFAGFSLLFNGTKVIIHLKKEEKLMSIFNILQKEQEDGLKYKQVYCYFYNVLRFSLNNYFKIEEIIKISVSMTKDIYLANNIDNTQRITFQNIIDYIKDLI